MVRHELAVLQWWEPLRHSRSCRSTAELLCFTSFVGLAAVPAPVRDTRMLFAVPSCQARAGFLERRLFLCRAVLEWGFCARALPDDQG